MDTYASHPFVFKSGDILDNNGSFTVEAELDALALHSAQGREVDNKLAGGMILCLFAGETALGTEAVATAGRGEPFVTTFIILPVNDIHIGIAKIAKVIKVVIYVVARLITSGCCQESGDYKS